MILYLINTIVSEFNENGFTNISSSGAVILSFWSARLALPPFYKKEKMT